MSAVVSLVTSPEQARALAAHLLDPQRQHPVVVITSAAGQPRPYIAADDVADALGDLAEVFVLPTGPVTWAFADGLPDMTQVYGGAGRVYPIDDGWQRDPYRSKLRFAFSPADSAVVADRLISDALGAVAARATTVRPTTSTRRVSGSVIGVIAPSRALVRLDGGGMATVWHELEFPDVEIDRVFAKGMAVQGILDAERGRLDIGAARVPAEQAVAGYRVDDVVLARVAAVTGTTARLELFPGVAVELTADQVTGNPLDLLTSLLTVHEVVTARVTAVPGGDGGRWGLSLLDVEDDEPAQPAPMLLPGGPPWLVPAPPQPPTPALAPPAAPRLVAPLPQSVPTPKAAADAHGPARRDALQATQLSLEAARAEVTRLQGDLEEAERQAAQARADLSTMGGERDALAAALQEEARHATEQTRALERLRTDLRKAVAGRQRAEKALRAAETRHEPRDADRQVFLDPEAQFRHEVYLAWAQRIPAADKPNRPLAPLAFGPDFLRSVEELEGVERQKTVDVVVEIATGLVDEVNGRDLHRLRYSAAGGGPVRSRADGAVCWRAALQVNTPSARRIHFWRGPAGIELSRVVVHDDMSP